jgi:tRNA nucleotidyltransferase (CCA-adding enzyme)
MSIFHSLLGRRHFLTSAAVGSSLIMPVWAHAGEAVDEALSGTSGSGGAGIRPFKFRATEAALAIKADTITRVSVERIASELCRMLGGKKPSRGLEIMSRTGLLARVLALHENPYFTTKSAHFEAVDALPRESMLRLSLLLCGADEQSAKAACRTLKLSTKQTDAVASYISALALPAPQTDAELRRYMADVGEHTDGALRLSQVCGKIPDAQALIDRCERIRARGDCLSPKELAVNGRHLIGVGFSGADVGRVLAALYEAVLDDPTQNQEDILMQMAEKMRH